MSLGKLTKVHKLDKAKLKRTFDEEVSLTDKEAVWRILNLFGYVDEVCKGSSTWEEFKELVGEVHRELSGRTKPPGRKPRRYYRVDVKLTALEAEHARASTTYVAKRVAALPEIRSFRDKKLDGGTLPPEQVVTFLQGELESIPPKDYDELVGVDFYIAHSHLSLGEEEELKDLVGGWKHRRYEPSDEYSDRAYREGLKFDDMSIPMDPDPPYQSGLMHLVSDETGRTLEDVGRWVSYLSTWTIRDAAWFVLTGEPPKMEFLEVLSGERGETHMLAFAPWISEKTIRRAYRSLQNSDNQPLRQKSLAAFRFVEEHTEPGQTPRWAELTQQWNEWYPEDRFTDRSALRRAYKRAEERLSSPWLNSMAKRSSRFGATE